MPPKVPSTFSPSIGLGLAPAFLLFVSFLIVAYSTIVLFNLRLIDVDWTSHVAFVFMVWATVYVICSRASFGSFYLFSNSYVLMLCLFHLSFTVLVGLGLFEGAIWQGLSGRAWRASIWNEKAAWYTIVALGCFGIGMSLSVLTHSKRRELPPSPAAADNTLDQAFWVGLGMSIASGILLAYAVAVMGNLLQYERADMYRSTGSDIRGLGVFIMTFPAAITLLVIGARKRWITGMTLAIAAISFLILLLVGDRSIAMTPVLVGAILWVKTGRRISPPLASGALAFVLVVIPAIGLLRQEGPYSDISRKEIEQSLEETKFFQSFAIMGQSGGVLGHILRLVPEKYPHRYGSSYAKALASAIPNIETDISKGTRQALKHRSRIGSAPLDELAPDKWLSHELLGRDRVRRGHGVGFSAIGEAYLNFGYPGVVGVFVIFGFLLGKMDLRNVLMHPKLLIFAAAMFPHFVFTTRNQFSTFIKPAAFLLIIIVLWHFGTWWFRPGKKSGSESPEPPEADPINLLETTRG